MRDCVHWLFFGRMRGQRGGRGVCASNYLSLNPLAVLRMHHVICALPLCVPAAVSCGFSFVHRLGTDIAESGLIAVTRVLVSGGGGMLHVRVQEVL